MGDSAQPGGGTADARTCPRCGRPMAPTASFCRSCGARYEEPTPAPAPAPAAPPPAPEPAGSTKGRRSAAGLVFLALAIVLAGAGIAAAIALSGSGGSSSTTVLTVREQPTDEGTGELGATSDDGDAPTATAGAVEAGRYIQAGSFKFLDDAEAERERLAGEGIDVQVVSSETAQELYPGFQVLLAGPLQAGSEEALLLKQLHRHGVPSAFARDLTPAAELHGYDVLEGTWTGWLEESSTSRPRLNRKLHLTLAMDPGGRGGMMVFLNVECVFRLTAAGPPTGASFSFDQESDCIGSGTWRLRPSEGGLTLTLLPPDSDLIVLGTLEPA
jgi:SPOR domain